MSVCQYGHPFTGRHCQQCKAVTRAAGRLGIVRTKAPGEPDALVVEDDWREDAACRYPPHDLDADAWFARQQRLVDRETIRLVKAVCDDCPVRAACLEYAFDTRQPWGVWGGMTAVERGTAYHQQKTG